MVADTGKSCKRKRKHISTGFAVVKCRRYVARWTVRVTRRSLFKVKEACKKILLCSSLSEVADTRDILFCLKKYRFRFWLGHLRKVMQLWRARKQSLLLLTLTFLLSIRLDLMLRCGSTIKCCGSAKDKNCLGFGKRWCFKSQRCYETLNFWELIGRGLCWTQKTFWDSI